MFVKIDVAPYPPVVTLEEPDDTKKFHVCVVGSTDPQSSWGLVFGALVDAAAGRLEGDEAFITVDAVRRMAHDRVGPAWDDDFSAMLVFARTKGWLDDNDVAIKAHVEWSS